MFVRLAFAIQANVDPEILIVDEALAVGDAYFVHRCMLRFNELQKSGTTILFVSHDANSVRNLCSRAIWLVDGVIKHQGGSSEVVDAYLAHLFGRQVVTANSTSATKPESLNKNHIQVCGWKPQYQILIVVWEIKNVRLSVSGCMTKQ